MEKEPIKSHEDLEVYKMAFDVAMKIFQLSKKFPIEERYSLTDQIRRSSRSVCANLAEAWRKRRYEAAFIAKLKKRQGSREQGAGGIVQMGIRPHPHLNHL
jgi:23S rRNA-intervening sequence protein